MSMSVQLHQSCPRPVGETSPDFPVGKQNQDGNPGQEAILVFCSLLTVCEVDHTRLSTRIPLILKFTGGQTLEAGTVASGLNARLRSGSSHGGREERRGEERRRTHMNAGIEVNLRSDEREESENGLRPTHANQQTGSTRQLIKQIRFLVRLLRIGVAVTPLQLAPLYSCGGTKIESQDGWPTWNS